jgi:fido (protein-threonine AMPylation protein)
MIQLAYNNDTIRSMIKISSRQQNIYKYITANAPVSNKQIVDYLSTKKKPISRVTVIRDIENLISSGLVKQSGKGRGVVYQEVVASPLLAYIDPETYFEVDPDNREVSFKEFNFDVFDLITADLFAEAELSELEELNEGYRQRLKELSPAIVRKEYERLSIELSWKSSQIEGNTYSLLDTEMLIKENKETPGHTKEEAVMILNHKRALDYILDNKDDFKNITVAKIENLHQLLVKDMDISRNIRQHAVGITGTKYRPLDNEFQIVEALEKMINILNKASINPIVRAFLSVLMISYIQPFEDGNKRTARLLGNALLLANNYSSLSYRSVDESEYKKAMLLFYEQNNVRFFKDLFVKQFEFAVHNYFQI